MYCCTSSVCIVSRRDVQFSDIIVLWQNGVNVLFIRPNDVTNSEHKLRQFSNSLTFYFRSLMDEVSLYINLSRSYIWWKSQYKDNSITKLYRKLMDTIAPRTLLKLKIKNKRNECVLHFYFALLKKNVSMKCNL